MVLLLLSYTDSPCSLLIVVDQQGTSGDAMISDGPHNGVYGLGACFQANANSRSLPGAEETTRFADPYTVLAKRERLIHLVPGGVLGIFLLMQYRILFATKEEWIRAALQWNNNYVGSWCCGSDNSSADWG